MKTLKIAGLCLMAMLVLSIAAGASAAAETKPYIVQCRETPGKGQWEDGQCSHTKPNGGWETRAGGSMNDETFGATSGASVLKTTPLGNELKCSSDVISGKITGPKTVGNVVITFSRCKEAAHSAECQNQGPGVIRTNPLKGKIGYLNKEETKVGLALEPEGAAGTLFASFTCHFSSGINWEVKKQVIGELETLNTMSLTNKLVFAQSGGVQEWLNLLGETANRFETKVGGSGFNFEESGLEGVDEITTQFDMEIVA